MDWPLEFDQFGVIRLERGIHTITLNYHEGGLRPGSAGMTMAEYLAGLAPPSMGPLVLSDQTASRSFESTSPSDAQSLCGRRLDWIEAVGP
jgi:hypothetical protein